ncbi:MAG: hypothetical protein ABIM46_05515 [candidate division WOR-3 bacterium]
MIMIALALALFPPQEWPFWRDFAEAWVRGEINSPRFSLSSLSRDEIAVFGDGPLSKRLGRYLTWDGHFWLCSVPGGHSTAGLIVEREGLGLVAEPGFVSGLDALGMKSWNTGATGLLPSKEITAGFTRLYLTYESGELLIFAGRQKPFFSPLILSGLPADGLGFTYARGPLSFSYLVLQLDDYRADSAEWFKERWLEPGDRVRRFLIGKRIEWAPSGNLTLSFTEGGAYATLFGLPPLSALNPLTSLYINQWVYQDNCNILWELGMSARIKGVGIFASLLIDDMQFNPDYWDEEPADLGFYIKSLIPIGGFYLEGGHSGVSAFTYNNTKKWDRYSLHGVSLGITDGPGSNRTWAEAGWHMSENLSFAGGFLSAQRGSTSLETPNPKTGEYPDGWYLVPPAKTENFCYWKMNLARGQSWFVLTAGGGTSWFGRLSTGFLLPW